MGESRSSAAPRLDLNNFDSTEAESSRVVLTSPRSLTSCARLGVRPVQLLIKSLNELIAEQHTVPLEAVKVMHESYETERRRLLQMCRDERQRIISGGRRSSCSASELREADRDTLFTLRDLRHSPATEAELERLTADITKKMCVRISEKDRRIAAVMLAKHQEEQERLKLCRQEEQQQQEAQRQEEALQAQAEKKRRKKLMQSMQRWQEELERVEQLQQEMLLQEERWRRLKEEVEVQRRQKMVAAQKELEGRKCCQETLLKLKEEVEKRQREQERQVAVEREQKARRRKVLQDKKEKKRLQEENRGQQVEAEEEKTRTALEKKLHDSWERRSQAADARLSELQERAAQEEQQIQRAQLRAELHNIQQLLHRRLLVQLSQRRADRAAQNTSAQMRTRAQQIRQHNKLRQLLHQRLREKLQREEELRRQRQQLQEEAHRRARASFHIRDRVRQHTHTRNFAQMLLEAQLTASISRMTL
ncbi:LOW QUALITY PROTEIN: uncharacterized protein LOC144742260 [Lampetra planeri]